MLFWIFNRKSSFERWKTTIKNFFLFNHKSKSLSAVLHEKWTKSSASLMAGWLMWKFIKFFSTHSHVSRTQSEPRSTHSVVVFVSSIFHFGVGVDLTEITTMWHSSKIYIYTPNILFRTIHGCCERRWKYEKSSSKSRKISNIKESSVRFTLIELIAELIIKINPLAWESLSFFIIFDFDWDDCLPSVHSLLRLESFSET